MLMHSLKFQYHLWRWMMDVMDSLRAERYLLPRINPVWLSLCTFNPFSTASAVCWTQALRTARSGHLRALYT